jgi:signal transduction histidine kinase
VKVGTRLLLLLLPTVVGVMAVSATVALRSRQQALMQETRLETSAYATALAVAFNHALREVKRENVQDVLNEVSRVTTVYGVLVYDQTGALQFAGDSLKHPTPLPPEVLRQVLAGHPATLERELDGESVFSAVQPVHGARGRITGALEVAQPLSLISEELARTRNRYLAATIALVLAVAGVTLWLVTRTVSQPLEQLVEGVNAVGQGDLNQQIPVHSPAELASLARAFNAMTERLQEARATAAREADERLLLERRLRESEQMATIGSLAAGLAHEIAAPLNVISGRAEMLMEREFDAPGRERQLGIIIRQIGRITTIVRNLLDFARRPEVKPRPVQVAAVLAGVQDLLDEEMRRAEVALTTDVPGNLWVEGDPDLLHQVFVNLYLNAVQAMEPQEGERQLTVTATMSSPMLGEAAPMVMVAVSDTGPGVPRELRERVFDPFVTTKPRGTGLGLVVAKSIVAEHGGEMLVRNRADGVGAVFEVRLRSAAASAAALEPEAAARG